MPVTEPVLMIAEPGFMCGDRRLRHVEIAVEVGLQRRVEMLGREVLEFVRNAPGRRRC